MAHNNFGACNECALNGNAARCSFYSKPFDSFSVVRANSVGVGKEGKTASKGSAESPSLEETGSWPPTPRLGLSTPATRRLVPAPTAFSQIGLGCLVAALCVRRRTPLSPALLASWRQVGLYYVVFICS